MSNAGIALASDFFINVEISSSYSLLFSLAVSSDQTPRQIPRKVRPVKTIHLIQPPGDVHARILLRRDLDVRISLVVPQQDIEARLVLLDQVVLKRQRFLLVIHKNVVQRDSDAHQRAGLRLSQPLVGKIIANPRPQVFSLAHIDNSSLGVFIQIDARVLWKQGNSIPKGIKRIGCDTLRIAQNGIEE